uniref:Uncharacterized protein n=1 Tax=Arion vulgaris TaxID=1028688 RepID=A0A0B6ZTG2_9EUPU
MCLRYCFCNINIFLQYWILSPKPNPKHGGPGSHIYSGTSLVTCSVWVALAGTSSRHPSPLIIGVCKPPHPYKVKTSW